MRRALIILLILLTSTVTNTVFGQWEFLDLRDSLSAATTTEEQLEIVVEMREMFRAGTAHPGQAGMMIYVLSRKPVFNHPTVTSFLQELLENPNTVDVTATAIAYQMGFNTLSEHASKTFAEAMLKYHSEHGMSDEGIQNLQLALALGTPQANRVRALQILSSNPPDGDKRRKYLQSVASLLQPEITPDEKLVAIEILADAAKTEALPRRANSALAGTASRDRDAAVRVAAWPLAMPAKIAVRETDRGKHYFFGRRLVDQLTEPVESSKPTFVNADYAVRERAIELLNNYWDPEYHPEYIEALIQLVDRHDSVASAETLVELRRANKLNEEQIRALDDLTIEEPEVVQAVESIVVPKLAPGSLVGPLEIIENSNNPAEWAAATKLLLEQHPDGPVPMTVAEAANKAMFRSADYDPAAVALVARGDEPFAAREQKVLAMVDRTPRYSGVIVRSLQQLHGGAGYDELVQRYANDLSIEETFRGTILSSLYSEVRESGEMDDETTAAVIEFGESAENYFSVTTIIRLLEASGANVPLSIRLKDQSLQWSVLGWLGAAALAIGVCAGLYILVLVVLPGRKTRLTGVSRATGFLLWLMLSMGFVAAAGLSLLHSLGHTSSPPPDRAAPYYFATLGVAIMLMLLAIVLHRRRSAEATIDPAAARI